MASSPAFGRPLFDRDFFIPRGSKVLWKKEDLTQVCPAHP
jgi:hypothetical protein